MATVTRAQFPDWLTVDALPFLNAAVDSGRDLRQRWYEPVFRSESTNRPHEQFTTFAKFGTMTETDEGAPVIYDNPLQGFDKTLTPLDYSLGFRVTHRAFNDDRLGPLRNLAQGLGESDTETRNIFTGDIFNNGFSGSFTGADGVSLFNTAHVNEDGTTFRNELATSADFSITSFRTAQVDFASFTDGRGKKLNLIPTTILSALDNFHNIAEIIQSTDKPDTAERAINVTRGFFGGQPLNQMWTPYLTDVDAWFLLGDKGHELYPLVFLEREAFNSQSDVDFDTRTLKHAAWATYDVDFVGNGKMVYGSPGG